jgi:uncharacterized surface protein with fasciclin (FAS1) repeats
MTMVKAVLAGVALAVSAGLAVSGGPGCGSKAEKSGCGSYAEKSGCGSSQTAMTVASLGEKNIVEVAAGAGTFNTLIAAAKAAGLVEALTGPGPITVFAPTDEAFAKLGEEKIAKLLLPENKDKLTAILLYHVVPGTVKAEQVVTLTNATTLNGQRVDIAASAAGVRLDKNVKVVQTDIGASNGVIHVIDTVLVPEMKTIVEVADAAGSFGTLLAAAKAAGLAELLGSEGPFTVFAPTDEAFAKLPAGTVESLLKPENKGKLADILKYHVVPGRIYSEQALEAGKAGTALGKEITISAKGGTAKVNDATLVATDIEASNGVIHVIDSVILPK